MLEVLERNELLDKAERLAAVRDFQGLATLLQGIPKTLLYSDSELGVLLALALYQTDRYQAALTLIDSVSDAFPIVWERRQDRRRLNLRASCLLHTGNLKSAERLLLDILAAANVDEDNLFIASATTNLGVISDIRCEWPDAIAAYQRATAAFQRLGDESAIAACHHNLGMAHRQLGRLTESAANFDIALEYFRVCGSREEVAGTELERAMLYIAMGDLDRAEMTVRRSHTLMSSVRNNRMLGEVSRVAGIILLRRGDVDSARRSLAHGLFFAEQAKNPLLAAEICEAMAAVEHDRSAVTSEGWRRRAQQAYLSLGADYRARRAMVQVLR